MHLVDLHAPTNRRSPDLNSGPGAWQPDRACAPQRSDLPLRHKCRRLNMSSTFFHAVARPNWPAEAQCSVRSPVAFASSTYFEQEWTDLDVIQHKWYVHGARAWNNQLWGSGGQRSRTHEAEVRFGDWWWHHSWPLGWPAFVIHFQVAPPC